MGLLKEGFTATTVLFGPSDGQPSLFGQLTGQVATEPVLFLGVGAEDGLVLGRHFLAEEFRELVPEFLLFFAKFELHFGLILGVAESKRATTRVAPRLGALADALA